MRKKSKKKTSQRNFSKISQHKMEGHRLIAPLNTIPSLSPTSWRDSYAPEFLWAFLLAIQTSRDVYLAIFRDIASWAKSLKKSNDDARSDSKDERVLINVKSDVDLTNLATLTDSDFSAFLSVLKRHKNAVHILRPLLLIKCIPGIERWKNELKAEPIDDDWKTLGQSIVPALDHQSEISTDIRWLKYLIPIIKGDMRFPIEMKERVEEVLDFPHRGEMRAVRPFIRAGEMAFRRDPPSVWIEQFWVECFQNTECVDISTQRDYAFKSKPEVTIEEIDQIRQEISTAFHSVNKTSFIDPKLDTCFGFCMFAVSILEELAVTPVSNLILGRLGLRSIVEVFISFKYLTLKNDERLWREFRSYGSGQAKLAFLKLEEESGEGPEFVDVSTLEALANEDTWQEFQDINLGHWDTKSLRKLAQECDALEVYNNYYGWTSSFMHGNWSAIRDSNYVTCMNPLHRLHRIPRPYQRSMPSVVGDVAMLINMIFEQLEINYPSAKLSRFAISKEEQKAEEDVGAEG